MTLARPTVVIFADASYSHQTGLGGWGCWIKADGHRSMTRGGPLRGRPDGPVHAEAMALANAVHVAAAAHMLTLGAVALLQTDCLNVLQVLRTRDGSVLDNPAPDGLAVPTTRSKALIAKVAGPVDVVLTLCRDRSVSIQVRHVKGHQRGKGRNWVNRRCDGLARWGRLQREADAA